MTQKAVDKSFEKLKETMKKFEERKIKEQNFSSEINNPLDNRNSNISRRDYFAALAMQGIITARGTHSAIPHQIVGEQSFKYADEMIKESQKH